MAPSSYARCQAPGTRHPTSPVQLVANETNPIRTKRGPANSVHTSKARLDSPPTSPGVLFRLPSTPMPTSEADGHRRRHPRRNTRRAAPAPDHASGTAEHQGGADQHDDDPRIRANSTHLGTVRSRQAGLPPTTLSRAGWSYLPRHPYRRRGATEAISATAARRKWRLTLS